MSTTTMGRVTVRLLCGMGFEDYDVNGHPRVKRICIGRNLKQGDIFNVYEFSGRKTGGTWKGTLQASLKEVLDTEFEVKAGPPGASHVDAHGIYWARREYLRADSGDPPHMMWHSYCPANGWVKEPFVRFTEKLVPLENQA